MRQTFGLCAGKEKQKKWIHVKDKLLNKTFWQPKFACFFFASPHPYPAVHEPYVVLYFGYVHVHYAMDFYRITTNTRGTPKKRGVYLIQCKKTSRQSGPNKLWVSCVNKSCEWHRFLFVVINILVRGNAIYYKQTKCEYFSISAIFWQRHNKFLTSCAGTWQSPWQAKVDNIISAERRNMIKADSALSLRPKKQSVFFQNKSNW